MPTRVGDYWRSYSTDLGVSREMQLHAELEGERANAAELRRLLAQQTAALEAIKRRKSVRAVVALDRYITRSRALPRAQRHRLGIWRNRINLLSGAIRNKRYLSDRREAIVAAIEGLVTAPPDPRTRSIVVVADDPVGARLHSTFRDGDEVIVVATRLSAGVPNALHRFVTSPVPESPAAAAARGGTAASGELLCFLAATCEPLEEGWLDRLGAVIRDDVVAAAPLLLHPERSFAQATAHDLRVRELGLDLVATSDGYPTMRAREAGGSPEPSRKPFEVVAASGACLVVNRNAYEAAGGFAPLDDLDAAAVDLCSRLSAQGGRVLAVPEAMVVDHRPVGSVAELTTPIDATGKGWRDVLDREGPALLRRARKGITAASLSIALTVAAPSSKVARRWGDWHVAEAFARSLRRLGHSVRVQAADRADDPAGRCCDVHVVLRGMQAVRRTPGQRHVLWIISHPEAIDAHEFDEADLVLAASPRLAAHLRDRSPTPVEVLLQATDPRRFRPLLPNPTYAHQVAIVAKSRDVVRKAVADALNAGLRPAIYGSGWEALVDPNLVVGDYVPNETLPLLYSSIGVLLADHWDAMRAWGMVSNRIFDALSCVTPVISDYLPEVRELFGEAVPMYRDGAELRSLVDEALADPAAARQRAATGRELVVAAHTFDHRARTFLDALARHGLDELPR
jgi:O-antigen biosynthesis protein